MLEPRLLLSGVVVGRFIFYNDSAYDGNSAALDGLDDAAIAVDKQALLPGYTATFANYTSYDKGLNGLMVDISGVGSVSAADFQFKVGNDNDPADWPLWAGTATVTVRPGAGVGGADRVEVAFPDGAIIGTWLQVTVKADAATGLAADDVFYFGNAIGETGNSATDASVNAADELGARAHAGDLATQSAEIAIANMYDFNRDRVVNAADEAVAGAHYTNFLNTLSLIRVPQQSGDMDVTHIETFDNSDGTINAANPPEGWTVNSMPAGGFSERPVGGYLTTQNVPLNDAGDPVGTSMIVTQSNWDISAPLGANRSSYYVGGWFFFDEQSNYDDGSHGVDQDWFLWIQDQRQDPFYGSPFALVYNADTGTVTPTNGSGIGTAGPPITVGFNTWVYFGVAVESVDGSTFTTRTFYKTQNAPLTGVWDDTISGPAGLYPTTVHITGNAIVNGKRWDGRMSFLTEAQISGVGDVTWQSNWADPPTGPTTWYVRRTADGTGDGLTYATAWSPAQMADELAHGGIVPVTHGSVYAATGLPVPDTIDVVDLDGGYQDGTIVRDGDTVLIDEEGQEIRMPGGLSIGYQAEGVEIAPYHSTQVQINCSTNVSGPAAGGTTEWTDEGNGVWSIPVPNATYNCLWENSEWMAFANNSNDAAIMAYCAANPGSFGFSAKKLYMKAFDGSDPNTNGNIYEIPGQGWLLRAPDEYVHDFSITKTAAAANVSLNGADPVYCVQFWCAGLTILRDLDTSYGGKHVFGTAEQAAYPRGSRVVILNCTAEQGIPSTAYGIGYGSQTAGVFYVDENSVVPANSNEIIFDGWDSTINSGKIGSTLGETDPSQSGFYSHTDGGNASLPFSKIVFRHFASSSTGAGAPISTTPWEATIDCLATWGTTAPEPVDGLIYIPDPFAPAGLPEVTAGAAPMSVANVVSPTVTGAIEVSPGPMTLAPVGDASPRTTGLVQANDHRHRAAARRPLVIHYVSSEKGLRQARSHVKGDGFSTDAVLKLITSP